MRYCDDLSDEAPAPGLFAAASLERWRSDLAAALEGRFSRHPLWPAFHDTVQRYGIPREYFGEMIDGVTSDLGPREIRTFDELYRYCYQVASVVGLTVIHIFGFHSGEALPLAEKCGVAFQLTNILRDIREDAGRGRTYIPAEDLERFGVARQDLLEGKRTGEFVEMMRFEAARARAYYRESMPLIGMVDAHSRSSLWALIQIYSRLLDHIEKSNYAVLSHRVELPLREKLWIILKAAVGAR